jgi:hypothetical protein
MINDYTYAYQLMLSEECTITLVNRFYLDSAIIAEA